MPIIIPANSAISSGYDVANGVRFDDASSSNFSDGSAPNGNRQKFTWSAWFKRSSIGATQILASSSYSGSDQGYLYFNSGNGLGWQSNNSGDGDLNTAMLFRDTSAWYHVVFSVDTTQSTATNRIKLYINGSQYTWDGSNTTPPNLNQSLYFNVGGSYNSYIGRRAGGDYFDGYMSEIVFIDNAQLAADSFGEFDSSGIWKPIESVADLTFGTSGYYLNFQNSGALGTDVSGVGNSFTANNLAAIDQTTDTCTNNFATWNDLINSNGSTSEANLKYTTSNSSSNYGFRLSSIGVSSGKWYAEIKYTSSSNQALIGIRSRQPTTPVHYIGYYNDGWGLYVNGKYFNNNVESSSLGTTYQGDDIIGIYLDCDNNKLYFSKNGALINSTGISITAPGSTTSGFYFFGATEWNSSGNGTFELNVGNPSFSVTSSNTDDNGYGNFEYSPNITGDGAAKKFYALNTKNLAEFG